ncbi:MAG TPA: radical SAM protein [Phycisphaerae bacterium]|nr:radical SAM protein [Phycisphaerae bacterium]
MSENGLARAVQGTWSKFRFGWPILRAKITGRPVLFQVQFTLTNHCNLRCAYCYADYPHRPAPDLPTEEIHRIIDDLHSVGTRRVNLVGGEPLVRNDIGEIVDHAKAKGLECAMTTNGYFVARRIETVRKLDLLCVSLDGPPAAHDRCRGEGSHAPAMEAIELAADNGIPLQVACVLTRFNLDCIEYLLDMGKRLGFAVGFSTLITAAGSNGSGRPEYLPTDAEYREALERILGYKAQGYPVLFSRKSLEYALSWKCGYDHDKIMGEEPGFSHIRCNAGRYFAIVDANGDLYPCPAMVDLFKPLNILKDGIARALEHAGRHPCKTCHIPCMNDFNLLYSLDVGVIMNILRTYRCRSPQNRPACVQPPAEPFAVPSVTRQVCNVE